MATKKKSTTKKAARRVVSRLPKSSTDGKPTGADLDAESAALDAKRNPLHGTRAIPRGPHDE